MIRILPFVIALTLLVGCASTETTETERRDAEAAALYTSAQTAIERGDWVTATQELEALQAQFPFGRYATQAQLDIIYVYYRSGDVGSTVAAAERFRRINPRHRNVAYTWYMQGLALEEKNQDTLKRWVGVDDTLRDPIPRRQAFEAYTTVIEQFPDSAYVDDARQRLDGLYNAGARYQLSIAEFYQIRRAWVAAAQRAITVITEFPGTPSVEPAMALLEQAYAALGITDLADNVRAARAPDANRPDGTPTMPSLYEGESIEVPNVPGGSGASGSQAPTPPSGDIMRR